MRRTGGNYYIIRGPLPLHLIQEHVPLIITITGRECEACGLFTQVVYRSGFTETLFLDWREAGQVDLTY
jgi:hypothetical protein